MDMWTWEGGGKSGMIWEIRIDTIMCKIDN